MITTKDSKGFELMKAMGFRDRGAHKYNFKTYENEDGGLLSSEDEDFDYADLETWAQRQSDLASFAEGEVYVPQKRKHSTAQPVKPKKKYYDGPITFKDNHYGFGYVPSQSDFEALESAKQRQSNRIHMSEFNYTGGGDDEDGDDMHPSSAVYEDEREERSSRYMKQI